MILLDVNPLVYAFHADARRHDEWRAWLDHAVGGGTVLRLCDHSVIGLYRIATNPRAFSVPSVVGAVTTFVDALRARPTVQFIHATTSTWATLAELTTHDRQIRANLMPDAYLAALAISHGCRLATADRGFGRFPGLDFFDPTA
jgi:toxin-antitoxin system PIN domain toxin